MQIVSARKYQVAKGPTVYDTFLPQKLGVSQHFFNAECQTGKLCMTTK